jgi:hypothetical protein
MASRGLVSLWACASNSDSVRSAQSAAHTASARRSASLRVKAPGWRSIPKDSLIGEPRLCCHLTDPDACDKCGRGPLDARRVRPLVYTIREC